MRTHTQKGFAPHHFLSKLPRILFNSMKSGGGFATLYFVLLSLFLVVSIAGSSFLLVSWQQRTSRNAQHSVQAYWAGEAGAEDAFLRLKKGMAWVNPLTLDAGEGAATTTIMETAPGVHLVTAQGDDASRIRKIQAVYQLSGTTPEFFYGAHVGAGGLVMDNNSQVIGNVFSNGNIGGDSGAIITNTATVAGAGSELEDVQVQGDAFVDECEDAEVDGTLHVNTNDGCAFGAIVPLGTPPSSVPLPISATEIQEWKDGAVAGGVITGTYRLDGTDVGTMGPKKIVGDLIVEDKAILTLTGNLWVTGKVDVKNEAQVRLHASFGSASGVIVADGLITLQNSSVSSGSGELSSYLMYLSTKNSDPAINVKNNAIADILYTSAGWILVENNDALREVTGYGIHLKNNAVITYESGLQDARFTSGPGASFELSSWQEVE